jgi:hypothetical protein
MTDPLVLPPELMERVAFLRRQTDAASDAYLVGQAIRLYYRVALDVRSGKARLLLDFGGRREEISLE